MDVYFAIIYKTVCIQFKNLSEYVLYCTISNITKIQKINLDIIL